jgi:hypothetical protein
MIVFGAIMIIGQIDEGSPLMILYSIAMLVAGIIGVTSCKSREKAGMVMVVGWITLALSVITSAEVVLDLMANDTNREMHGAAYMIGFVIGAFIDAILPVLMIVGARKRKAAEE